MANENNSASQTSANHPPAPKGLRAVVPLEIANPSARYYVALDLGSESMAACYCVIGGEENQDMIQLQYYAKDLVEAGAPLLPTHYFYKAASPSLQSSAARC